jgi:hypothetical protein
MFHSSWRKLSRLAFAAVAVLGIAAQTQAVTTISTFSGADPGEGLDLTGNFIYALDVGPNTSAGQIGDANFVADNTTAAQVIATQNIAVGGWGAANFGAGVDDTRLGTVMRSIRWSDAPNNVTVNLPNLVVGESYKLQLLLGEECCNRGFDVVAEGVIVKAGVNPQQASGNTTASGRGTVLTHTFIATDTTLNIDLDQNNPGFPDNNPILNGLTLEQTSFTPVTVTTVSKGMFTGADPGEGLDFQGNFTHAVNVGGPAQTVGDASFASGLPGQNGPNSVVQAINHIPNWTAPNLGNSADDDALEQVVNSIRWTEQNQNGGDISVDLAGLTVGDPYKVQLLFTEACCNNRAFDVFVDGAMILDDFAPGLEQGGASGAPSAGSFITFEFTATSALASIRLNGRQTATQFTDHNPILSGFTVENIAIPEPASAMLGVMGIAALAFRRRRAA